MVTESRIGGTASQGSAKLATTNSTSYRMKRKKKVIKGFDRSYEMKKADEAFSRYTRIRWSDKDGICTCITCGRMKHWKEVDAGHYRRREHQSTRFDEKNVHPQCRYCNFYRGGAEAEHREYIDSTYGDGTAYQIEQKSLMRSKRTAFDMHMIRKEYEQKLKDLCEERGIILKPTKKKASNEPEESQGESENKQGTAGDV